MAGVILRSRLRRVPEKRTEERRAGCPPRGGWEEGEERSTGSREGGDRGGAPWQRVRPSVRLRERPLWGGLPGGPGFLPLMAARLGAAAAGPSRKVLTRFLPLWRLELHSGWEQAGPRFLPLLHPSLSGEGRGGEGRGQARRTAHAEGVLLRGAG